MPVPIQRTSNGFSPFVPATSTVSGEVRTLALSTTTDKVKVVFSTYRHRARWTEEWIGYFGLAVSVLGLAFSIKFSEFTIFGFGLSLNCVRFILILFALSFGIVVVRCLYRLWKYRGKLSCSYFVDQLRAESPDVE